MKTICDCCGHDWETPDKFIAHMHPPKGAVRLMQMEGCPKCGDGQGGAFYWRMEDGTTKSALAGIDELEDEGITILDFERNKRAVRK
jgi:hypothetical protein